MDFLAIPTPYKGILPFLKELLIGRKILDSRKILAIDIAAFGEYFPSVVTRDSPCWIPGTAPMS